MPGRLPWVALLSLALLLSGCASAPAETGAAARPSGSAPSGGDATTVEAIRVVPDAYPIEVAGHLKPVPCLGVNRRCDAGAQVQPPGQPSTASAGLEWTTLSQAFTDRGGLFWRIRVDGTWASSTPAVTGVRLTVGTRPSSCGTCETRPAFTQDSDGPRITVERTDVFLRGGEDTLVYRVEPRGVGWDSPDSAHPADDVKVDLHGWAAAFVAAGPSIVITQPDA